MTELLRKWELSVKKVTSKSQVCEMLATFVATELELLYVIVMGHFCKLAPSVQRIVLREKEGNLSKCKVATSVVL